MLGDLISCKSKYQNKVLLSLSHGITIIGLSGGNLLPVLLFADKFRSDFTARGIDPEYMDTLINFLKGPMSLVVILLSFISGIVGIYIGNKIFKKHFENAGHIQSKHI